MITAKNLKKYVTTGDDVLHILENINLSIKPAESVAILGSSGAGKSTLLGILAGLDTPSSGSVHLNEAEITTLDEDGRAAVRQGTVGFVFQSFRLIPSLTALENVMLPLELSGKSNVLKTAKQWLVRVGLENRAKHFPEQLSGGEQQRVAIARAFVIEPKILFADEPTGNLDETTAAVIINLLFELNQDTKTTLVIVTHDEHIAARCQRRLQLHNGTLA